MATKKPTVRPKLKSGTVKAGSAKKTPMSIAQDITNRYRVTAREARDIVTAVGNFGNRVLPGNTPRQQPGVKGPLGKNLVKQIKETGVAAVTGKKGTTSDRIGLAREGSSGWYTNQYTKGTQRTSRQTGASKKMNNKKSAKGN